LWKRRDRALYYLGLRLADVIVVQTEEQVRLCQATFGKRPELIHSLAPVIGQQQEEPEAFLWVGRLVSYKEPLAYVELARACPEARFWMVGVPSPNPREEAFATVVADAAKSVPNLELLEPRPHAEIGRLMDRAVASVNTATFEGMPNVLLEAWARGVPALVLHHDPGEVVSTYGLGGFANGSPAKLAELARALWNERYDRDELAQRCLSYIERQHSPEAAASRWAEALGLSLLTTVPERNPVHEPCAG
jgi:glycosyltransferase involved in cell wall biosynthesis